MHKFCVRFNNKVFNNRLEESDRRSILKLCRLLQAMNDEKQTEDENTKNKFSLLEIALKNDITEQFASALIDKEKEVNEQIEKEEEEARLEAIRIETERKEKEEKLRLKKEEDLKKKQEQDKNARLLALKSLDEMVKSEYWLIDSELLCR